MRPLNEGDALLLAMRKPIIHTGLSRFAWTILAVNILCAQETHKAAPSAPAPAVDPKLLQRAFSRGLYTSTSRVLRS
jgi:hypothetical protein